MRTLQSQVLAAAFSVVEAENRVNVDYVKALRPQPRGPGWRVSALVTTCRSSQARRIEHAVSQITCDVQQTRVMWLLR